MNDRTMDDKTNDYDADGYTDEHGGAAADRHDDGAQAPRIDTAGAPLSDTAGAPLSDDLAGAPQSDDMAEAPLFDTAEAERLRVRWVELQAAFVDEPRTAVRQADELVAEVMQTLASTFADNKRELEGQWQREGEADTEDLRLALRRYRSFFDQLLRV